MKKSAPLLIGFFLGLALKIPSIFYNGMFDLITYSEWGRAVLEKGLRSAYYGIYFPLQYQIFGFAEYMNVKFGFYPDNFISYKIINLCFDIGIFLLLVKILKKYSLNVGYALLYWLLPWFINVLWLGYIDFHFSFFILLFILMYNDNEKGPLRIIICGIPLALAFLMKPQVQIIFLSVAIYQVVESYRRKTYLGILVLLPSIVLFILYGWNIGFLHTLKTYLSVSFVMPSLTAQMLNFWYPVAYVLKQANDPIYIIYDTVVSIAQFPVLRIAAALCVLTTNIIFIFKLKPSKYNILFIITFCSVIVPFLMTSAHENHLFLGSVLLCLCMPVFSDKGFTIFSILLICIQQINIFFLYQLGANRFSVIDISLYYYFHIDLILSFVSCFIFVAILFFMMKKCSIEDLSLPAKRYGANMPKSSEMT